MSNVLFVFCELERREIKGECERERVKERERKNEHKGR